MKYNEEELLKELKDYIAGTYNQHYATDNASRYDKKGTARRDIIKILHYGLLLLYFSDQSAKREENPQ